MSTHGSGTPGSDLGRWAHGESNDVECVDGCGSLGSNLSDGRARSAARRHARDRRHMVEISRTYFQTVYPPREEQE